MRIAAGVSGARERVAAITAFGEAAVEAALSAWRAVQDRLALSVPPTAIDAPARQIAALREA